MKKNRIRSMVLTLGLVCITSATAFAQYGNTGSKSDYNGVTINGSLYGSTTDGQAGTNLSGSGAAGAYAYLEGCDSSGYRLDGLKNEATGSTSAWTSVEVGRSIPTTWHSGHANDRLSGNDQLFLWIEA